jgi:hypothetical protein
MEDTALDWNQQARDLQQHLSLCFGSEQDPNVFTDTSPASTHTSFTKAPRTRAEVTPRSNRREHKEKRGRSRPQAAKSRRSRTSDRGVSRRPSRSSRSPRRRNATTKDGSSSRSRSYANPGASSTSRSPSSRKRRKARRRRSLSHSRSKSPSLERTREDQGPVMGDSQSSLFDDESSHGVDGAPAGRSMLVPGSATRPLFGNPSPVRPRHIPPAQPKRLHLAESSRSVKRLHADQLMELQELRESVPFLDQMHGRQRSAAVVSLYSFLELVAGGAVGTRTVSFSGGQRSLPCLITLNKSKSAVPRRRDDYQYASMHEWVDEIASPLACRALLQAASVVKQGMDDVFVGNVCLGRLVKTEYAGRIHFVQMVSFFLEQFAGQASWRASAKPYHLTSSAMTSDAFDNLCHNEAYRIVI